MINVNLDELDKIRRSGFRPQVVGCFLNSNKILFVFDKKYNLWQFPQGGIDNEESIDDAFKREMAEELGGNFSKMVDVDKEAWEIFDENQVTFPKSEQNKRALKSDEGERLFLNGKHYFFIATEACSPELDIDDTEFDDYQWVNFDEAMRLAEGIYQKGKQRIIVRALVGLKENGFL